MDKQLAAKVLERSEGLCELCHSPKMTQIHHIIKGRGKRKQHETEESLIMLCWDCHYGNEGIHGKNGYELDVKLKKVVQAKYFDKGYTESEVRKMLGGRLY